ncbi:MAG TPA: hypothetical protein VHT53_07965, partial [Candidatus Elarobacter sp.]|nr:hypothetical protein [Candidatus Elarobacter sp.]
PTDVAGFVSFALPLAMAICAPLTSGLVRRAGTLGATRIALVALGAGTGGIAVIVAYRGPLVPLGACLLLVGGAVAIAYTSTAVGATATAAGRFGAGIGLYNLLRIAGTAIGAALVAIVLRYDPGGFTAIFAICAGITAAGLLGTYAPERAARVESASA